MTETCALCGRPLIPGPSVDEHHLVPKSYKGKDTILIHRICHNTIHATFTEKQLAKHYHTVERLLSDERIQRFVKWVAKKHPEFYTSTKK